MLWTVPLLAGLLAAASCQPQPLVLPEPRVVILGQTGAGKSTVSNVLLGQIPDCSNCTFTVCEGHDSCTKNTKYAVGSWLGEGPAFTIVDTPGFGDSDNEDTELIDEMMGVLHNAVKGANALVLLINGQEERFDASFQQMMREMQALFGEEFWLHTIIGVSHWAYDANSVAQRNYTNKTEEIFMAEWNTLLQEKFHIEEKLSGVFIDSFSQQPWNLEDALQQAAFARETEKLWTFASEQELFPFRTIGDVLQENQDLKEENRWLNDVIKNNISELTALISANKDQIGKNSDQVAINTVDVSSNSENIGKNKIAVNLRIDDVVEDLTHINDALIGTVIAWLGGNTFPLPEGWQKCDGSPILDGPLKGKNTPNLNSEGRFLRGGTVTESWTVQDDMVQDHHHGITDKGHEHTDTGHKHDDGGHTHADGGHTHIDSGHTHIYLSTNWMIGDDYDTKHTYRGPDNWHHTGQGVMRTDNCDLPYCDGYGSKANILSSKASIQSAHASIQTGHSSIASSHTGISVTGATAANVGSETRPKNIVVEWIIKVT